MSNLFGHSARHAALLVVQIAMATALFALLLLITERHNRRFDLTPTKSFVLSKEARRVARGVRIPIRITMFYNSQEHGQHRQMEDLLQLFADASPRITYRMVDLDRSPALAKKFGISSFNTGVMEAPAVIENLHSWDEEEITRALLKLTRHGERTLCFTTAHGEHSPQDASDRTGYSEVAKALEKENFTIRTLEAVADGVPPECSVVIMPGPARDLLPGEANHLSRYLDSGGHALVMIDPEGPPSIVSFLAQYDVQADNDIVVDERNRLYGTDSFMPRVPIFDEGTFRKNLDTAAVFSLARSVSPIEHTKEEINQRRTKVLLIALSSPDSWAHVGGGTVPDGEVRFRRDKDKPGPLPVAVMVTAKDDSSGGRPPAAPSARPFGRMIVFGDSDFASNLYLNLLGNKDLFMSSIGVLAEDEELIAMRRKGLPRSSLSPISLTTRQGRMIFWMAVIIAPATCTMVGLVITWRRRRRGGA